MQVTDRVTVTLGPGLQVGADYEHGVRTGAVIERVRYHPKGGPVEVRAPVQVVANPRAAVRALRIDIRGAHVFTLTRQEIARALEWVDGSGWLQAVAALYRGEETGFTIILRDGTCAEWRVRPVRFLSLTPVQSSNCEVQAQHQRRELSA
ncbi:hypothetical protein [Streptomyces sp. NBC_00539]|uniref:hypothetical protein n=1 Tax=Streptomyces sp. NBC_00539 TaxID=2975770 RepID=UPI002E81266D|nr:hypothetical protein [Streptomyces sp. NBC_00539]WUC65837.1 hypothetical protein OG861_17215 [Streptomyces sp. NBC_00539]